MWKKIFLTALLAVAVGLGSWVSPAKAQVDNWQASFADKRLVVDGKGYKVSGTLFVDYVSLHPSYVTEGYADMYGLATLDLQPFGSFPNGLSLDCRWIGGRSSTSTWSFSCSAYENETLLSEWGAYMTVDPLISRKNATVVPVLLMSSGWTTTLDANWSIKW